MAKVPIRYWYQATPPYARLKSRGAPGEGWEPTLKAAKAQYAAEHPFRANVKLGEKVRHAVETAAATGAAGAAKFVKERYQEDPEGTIQAVKDLATGTFKILAAATLGYQLGKAIDGFTAYMGPAERKSRLALAYKHAREDAAAKLGRELTLEETAQMGRAFKAAVAKIDAGEKFKTTLDNFLR